MNTKESALSVKIAIFKFILCANPHEMGNNWEDICSEKYYKKGSQSNREAQVEMFTFYLQWSKVIQYATNSNEENQKPKYLQNYCAQSR